MEVNENCEIPNLGWEAEEFITIALKCILGLVCDPVAGLVEVPCVKRNASGVSLAFTAAELALAGIKSAIPVDEVIIAMKKELGTKKQIPPIYSAKKLNGKNGKGN